MTGCAALPVTVTAARSHLPENSCDTHLHVFGPIDRYPLDPRRGYTPDVCTLASYRQLMQGLGVDRAVLVQPSVYGTDNRAMLDALREGGSAFRGIAVPAPDISDEDLSDMYRLGVRGFRLNLVNPRILSIDDAVLLAHRVAPLGWHLQVQIDLARGGLATLIELTQRMPLPLVIDHMGLTDPQRVPPKLLALLHEGRCWIKLSAPYRIAGIVQPHHLASLVQALLDANPARLLWGSDWPHTEQASPTPQAVTWLDLLSLWLSDAAMRQQVFVDNPAHLYDF